MEPTTLKYLTDMYIYEDNAKVIDVKSGDTEEKMVILDQTIFYPQGGGQPSDIGTIEADGVVFRVNMVKFDAGIVGHYGVFESGEFKPGNEVTLKIDQETRDLNTRNHTAGHLLDSVIFDLGYDYLVPTKGFQFPEGSYVEYDGTVPEEEREELKLKLEEELNRRIQEGFEVIRKEVMKSELDQYTDFVPDYLPEDKPTWIVIVWGEKGLPCGGTHVQNLKDIGKITIRKLKCKKGGTKVSYLVE